MINVTTTAPAVQSRAPAAPSFDEERALFELRNTVNGMDCLSQEAFSAIATIARLALLALEQPVSNPQERELLAGALEAIWGKAETAQDSINAHAEEVGCAYIDEALRRRGAARPA